MSSYRPRSYTRPLRRKKSRWKAKVLILLVLLAGCWFGVPYVWNYAKKKLEPRTVTVTSQEEAMNRLKGVLSAWDMPSDELKAFAHQADQKFAWMENERARDAAKAILVLEMDTRGLWEQAQPMVAGLLDKRLKQSSDAEPGQKAALLKLIDEWGDRFARRGDLASAEKLYNLGLSEPPENEEYFVLLSKAIDLKQRQGDMNGVMAYLENLDASGPLLPLLKSPESIRKAAGYLLLGDQVRQGRGETSKEGENAAYNLLQKANLGSSPEMGRIMLGRLKDRLSDTSRLSAKEIESVRSELEGILVCFRSTGEDMVYAPEVMLAIARLYDQEDNVQHALLWANRAEGAAMALGVDTPRILDGKSIRETISTVRNNSRDKLRRQSVQQTVSSNIRHAGQLMEASDWAAARAAIAGNRELVKDSSFVDGYTPVLEWQLAKTYAGEEAWPRASAAYAALLAEWNQLTEQDAARLNDNLKQLGIDGLYQTLHRDLAAAYLKQNMVTKATETMQAIGEELPRQEPVRRSTRRSR